MHKLTLALLAALVASAPYSASFASGGQQKFVDNCSGCHGTEAEGIPGMAPPLNNPELWNKLGSKSSEYIAGVMTGGMSGTLHAKGNDYDGMVMPPQDFIDTADLVEISHYLLNEVNKVDGGPDAALIDKLKSAPKSHDDLHKLRDGG